MKATPEQITSIQTQDRSLVVEAGAGTGKTTVLVQRFIYLLEEHPDWPLESIIAITFTRKAAREMRSRIRRAIEEKAREHPSDPVWQERRRYLNRMQISTIHSLCARILRENAIAAGIDPQFETLEEEEAELLKDEAIRQTTARLVKEDDVSLELLASLQVYDLHSIMSDLLAKRGTVLHLFEELPDIDQLIQIWTKGIEDIRREEWNSQKHNNPELVDIIDSIKSIQITDPDDRLADTVARTQRGCLYLEQGDFISAFEDFLLINLVGGKKDNWGGAEPLKELKADLKLLRGAAQSLENAGALKIVGPEDEEAAKDLQLWRHLWLQLNDSYNQLKDEQAVLDFDDLEQLTWKLLQLSPRDDRLIAYLDQINHLMVDEFQDTNQIQQNIVYALAPPDEPGKLFVVGDAKQSIYRFRQAQVSVFNHTIQEIQRITDYPPETLSESFRTHRSLVDAFNHLFNRLLQPIGETFTDFEAYPGPLTAFRESPRPHPEAPSPIEIYLLPSKLPNDEPVNAEDGRIWEAQWLAHRLHILKENHFPVFDGELKEYRPFEYRDAAILFRATTQLPLYEAEFKSAGLPYMTVSGRGYYDRPEIQDLIALLTCIDIPTDNLSLAATFRSPMFNLSDETLYRLRWHKHEGGNNSKPIGYAQALNDPPHTDQPEQVARTAEILNNLWSLRGRVSVWKLVRNALDQTAFEVTLALMDRESGRQLNNVGKFMEFTRDHGGSSLSEFLRKVQDLRAREAREGEAPGSAPESGAVQLMSIHAAKGLEFPVVCVADLGRSKRGGGWSSYIMHDPEFGFVGKYRDENGDWQEPAGYTWGKWLDNRMEAAENKRLMYVACTRAADLLVLSGKLGRGESWMKELLEIWDLEPGGSEEEFIKFKEYSIRLLQPAEPEEYKTLVEQVFEPSIVLDHIPQLAKSLPKIHEPQPLSVTQLLGSFEEEEIEIRAPIYSRSDSTESRKVPGYIIGNIVHKMIADWDCLAMSEIDRRSRLVRLIRSEGLASSGSVSHAVKRSETMISNLLSHPLYEQINFAKKRYHELPFSYVSPIGPLHGVIDLIYQSANGDWHLIDWKTEWTPESEIEEVIGDFIPQLAAYKMAVKDTMSIESEATICFLYPKCFTRTITAEEIEAAWDEIHESQMERTY